MRYFEFLTKNEFRLSVQTFPSSASYYKLKRISELAVNVDDRKCQRFLQERPLVSLRKRRIIGLCLQLTLKGKRFVSDRFFQRLYKHSKRQCTEFLKYVLDLRMFFLRKSQFFDFPFWSIWQIFIDENLIWQDYKVS